MLDAIGERQDVFLSTPSARRATPLETDGSKEYRISIHALREEGDQLRDGLHHHLYHFYPRPPRGGRPRYAARIAGSAKFLSTPSARRAT